MTSHTFFYGPGSEKKSNVKSSSKQCITEVQGLPVATEYNTLSGLPALATHETAGAESALEMARANKQPAAVDDRLCTVREAAALLSVHPKTAEKMVRDGVLMKVPIGARNYRIARSEIDRFIRESQVPGNTR